MDADARGATEFDALRSAGVDLLFVDGEDYGASFDAPYADVLLGSQYFAGHLPTADYKPIYSILWDMIADKDLNITQEPNSMRAPPEVVSPVWQKDAELGYDKYCISKPYQHPVTEDHVPFIEKGCHFNTCVYVD